MTTFYYNPFALIPFASFLIMFLLGTVLYFRNNTSQTRPVIMLFMANALYSFFYSLEISFTTLPEILWIYRLEYLGISFLSAFYVIFALRYTGRSKWLPDRNIILLFLIPVITVIMVFTNSYHHLFYREEHMNNQGLFPVFAFTPGPWYWVQQVYVISTMLMSLYYLARMMGSAVSIYRNQLIFLLAGTTFPFVGYLAYQLHMIPFGIDPVSFTFTLTGIVIYIGLARFRLFDLEPVARSVLFDKIQDGVLVFDHNNRLIDYNTTAARQLNITRTDLGRNLTELEVLWPELFRYLQECDNCQRQLTRSQHGAEVHYSIQAINLGDNGVGYGKLTVVRDITELINSEQERRETASKLNAVIHAMPDMMFVIDQHGVFTDFFVSDTDNLFLNKDEVLGASLHDLFNEEEAVILMEMLKNCLLSSKLTTWQYEMNFPGTLKYYETRISRLDKDNALVIVRDVTESREMREDLEFQAGFQKILMDLASRFIHIATEETDAMITESLRQVGEYLGAARGYLFSYDYTLMAMSNTHEWCAAGIQPLQADRQMLPVIPNSDWYRSHQLGEPFVVESVKMLDPTDPVRISLEPAGMHSLLTIPIISQSVCIGYIGFEATREMQKWSGPEISLLRILSGMLASLQDKVNLDRSLTEARAKAEISNRLKTAFMNNISHEIRTPLNGIIGFGEIIANETLSMEEKNRFLAVVQESSERLIRTIDDYLDISMLVTGNQEVNPHVFNLSQFLGEVEKEHMLVAASKNLYLKFEISPEISELKVCTDHDLLLKVFSHLLGNSLKFTNKGGITISVDVRDEFARFVVRDTGVGIAGDALRHVFEPFRQEDFSSTRSYQGSGLGLSIVKEIITLLGGELTIDSIKRKGTAVGFTIPLTGSFTEHP